MSTPLKLVLLAVTLGCIYMFGYAVYGGLKLSLELPSRNGDDDDEEDDEETAARAGRDADEEEADEDASDEEEEADPDEEVGLDEPASRVATIRARAEDDPASPALDVLDPEDLEAALILSKADDELSAEDLTAVEALGLIARVGGHDPKRGEAPSDKALAKGMERIALTATGLKAARKS